MNTASLPAALIPEAPAMRKLINTLRHCNARRVAETALRNMDDRMLADIGLRRADIPSYVRRLI